MSYRYKMVIDSIYCSSKSYMFVHIRKIALFQGKCRQMFCPSGRIPLGSECEVKYTLKEVHFVMFFELRFLDSKTKLHPSFVENVNEDNFGRPFLQNWKIFLIVVKQWDDENTHSIIAILQATFKKIKFSYILNSIQKSLSVPWTVRFNNKTYELSAKFHNHVVYFESGPLFNNKTISLTPYHENANTLDEVTRSAHHFTLTQDWTNFKNSMKMYGGGVVITKMYFCNLIELGTFEYTEYMDEITVLGTNKTLATGEYLKVFAKDGDTRARICLEDLYPPQNIASRRGFSCIAVFVVWVTIWFRHVC